MTSPLLKIAMAALAAAAIIPGLQQDHDLFSSTTVDVGLVVSDADAAAHFYSEILGFRELPGFEVGGDFCRDAGLTDGRGLAVRVFVLDEGETATKIKLMQVDGSSPERADNAFVHSQLGLSYLTVFVRDLTDALKRLEDAGLHPLAKGPVPLGEGDSAPKLVLVRDPDGNLIELIGPRL